jgi:AGZA family xanthine/uracil permease-like MFS transporter
MSTFEQAPQGAEPRTPGHVESAPARAAVGSASGSGLLERVFKLAEHNTTVRIELVAGLTTFLTMAYIIFVNPSILGDAGMPKGAVFVATCIIAALGTLIMGLYANYPIAMAPGMGLNAYFSYVVVLGMGYTWQVALGAVFISGCLFLVVTVTGLRKLIIDGIPHSLRTAITVGIGMFLALVALKSAGVVAASPATFVTLGDLHTPPVILATLGFFVIVVLDRLKVRGRHPHRHPGGDGAVVLRGRQQVPRRVRGAAVGGAHLPAAGHHGRAEGRHPERGAGVLPGRDVRRHRHAHGRGQARRAAGARQDGAHEPALLADSGAIFAGSLLGTSSTTAYVESAAGVQAGGRTGLTAVVVALTPARAHHQALPRRGGQQRRVAAGAARRNPCRAGRERRRQVDADEDHLRLGQARRRQRLFNGQPVHIRNPQEARALGISMVFQHFSLFDTLTVAENVWLGLDKSLSSWPRWRAASPPRPGVRPGRRPRAAGAHAVGGRDAAGGDHPRAAHQPQAADPGRADLGADAAGGREAVRGAEAAGFRRLQHPLHQPQAARDPRAVHRLHGAARRQGHGRVRPAAREQCLAVAPDDRRRAAALEHREVHAGAVVLACRADAAARRPVRHRPRQASRFEVRAGEVVGIAGVSGNGQRSCCTRCRAKTARRGTMRSGRARPRAARPARRRALGLHFVPEERLGRGAVPTLGLAHNLLLTRSDAVGRSGWINRRAAAAGGGIIERFNVKAGGPNAAARRCRAATCRSSSSAARSTPTRSC